ncbi:MAG: hypothetical protein K8Q97_01090 [Candidatus Andersenbacteria bacterium]|nr:hypothetical protein [Candidatus Andersenbacteria bacterium]
MSSFATSRRVADMLFAIQITGAILSCSSQIVRSLADVHGISIAVFGLSVLHCGFHIWLGIAAHRACPTRLTVQAMITYGTWGVLTLMVVGAILVNGHYRWSVQDTSIVIVVCVLTTILVQICYWKEKTILDPAMKGLLAMTYKFTPNIFLAWKIFVEGGSGIPGLAIFIGHLTISIRVGQVYLMVREAGWDRNRVWLAISETSNEISWVVVTAVWLLS